MMLSASTVRVITKRTGPGQPLPVCVGTERELEDDDGKACYWSVEILTPKLIVKCGEQ